MTAPTTVAVAVAPDLAPDVEEAETFLRALAGSPDAPVTFQTFDDDAGRKRGDLARILHGPLRQHLAHLARLNQAGAGIFVMVNQGDGAGRREENVEALRAAFLDDDSGKLTAKDPALKPSIVVQSKGGIHAYWRLVAGEHLAAFQGAQEALAARYGTDPKVKDLPRVMRMPGFWHMKDRADPFLVRTLEARDVAYTVAEVLEGNGAPLLADSVSAPSGEKSTRVESLVATTGRDDVSRARAYLAKVPPAVEGDHGDDLTFRLAATLVVDFALSDRDALTLLREWNRTCAPPWPEKELAAKVAHARKYGKHPPGKKLPEPIFDLAARWRTFTPEELRSDPPEVRWVWRFLVEECAVGNFSAGGGTGKTATVAGLAVNRAMGWEFLGHPTKQGTTVICALEGGADAYQRRIASWQRWDPAIDVEKVARHVHVIDLVGFPFRFVEPDFGDYVPTRNVEALAALVKERAPDADLIVLETTSRLGGDEGNTANAALITAGETLARLTRAAVMYVSHVSQEAGRRGIGDQYAPRGGSALGDNGRFTLTLVPLMEDAAPKLLPGLSLSPQQLRELYVFRLAKVNEAPPQDPIILQAVPMRWGRVFRVYEAAQLSPEDREREARRALGQHLRDLAERYQRLSDALTISKLSAGAYKEIPGLSKQRINTAVADAVEDGLLRREARVGRGAGFVLLPGEKTGEKGTAP